MQNGRDKSSDPDAADEFGTLAPTRPVAAHLQETLAPSEAAKSSKPAAAPPAGDTKPDDIYATMAGATSTGQSMASLPSGPTVAPLPFDKVGDYDVLDKIGAGGMGLVLKARQRKLKRIVALKMIKLGQMAEEQEVARFLIEARAAAHLKHPNIVGVYEIGEHAGSPYFSMEYVEGQSLHKLVSERPLEPRRAAIILRKLALAVDYAHESGILHRDLKPHNILLDKYEEPKITDFGLATSAQENSQLTATGTVLGTPSYMPPEQARGKHDEMGKWSDVYSLGATLYEMLVGRPPFAAATLGETLQQVMTVDPVSPRTLNPAIPRDIETIALKCLEKAPVRRYQTAKDLADELQRFLDDRPILARPTTRAEKFVRWCRRNPFIAGSIAAVFLALVVAVVGLWIGMSQAVAARDEAQETAQGAMDLADRILNRLNEETLLEQPGMQPLKAGVYADVQESYELLLPKLEKSQLLPQNIAYVKSQLGLMKLQLGQRKAALELMNDAAESFQKLHEKNPTDMKMVTLLSKVKTEIGRSFFNERDYKAAAGPLEEALSLRKRLVELDPDNLAAGQLLANSEMNVGLLYEARKDPKSALAQYEAADKRRRELLQREPSNVSILRDRAKGLMNLGLFHAIRGNLSPAEKFYEEARKAFTTLTERKDHQLDDVHNLGITWKSLGDLAAVRNTSSDLQLAVQRYTEAVRVLQDLVQANANVRTYSGTLARARLNQAQLFMRQNSSHEAFIQLTIAFDELQKLRIEDPSFQMYSSKTFFEMVRLKKWKKLSDSDLQELATWVDFATQENGHIWVNELVRRAETAPEFPPALKLEETEMLSSESKSPKKPGR